MMNDDDDAGTFDLDALAAAIRVRGVPAYVEHTGGGVMAIYCGPRAVGPDGCERYAYAAGPGWARRNADGSMRVFADAGDFSHGPDDGTGDGITTTTADIAVLADAIAGAVRDARVDLDVRCPSCGVGWVGAVSTGEYPFVCTACGPLTSEACAAVGLDGSGRSWARSDWQDAGR